MSNDSPNLRIQESTMLCLKTYDKHITTVFTFSIYHMIHIRSFFRSVDVITMSHI